MCDYSLHYVKSRPAKVGDELVTTKFPSTITRGFAGVNEPDVAVCLLTGTELVFAEEARVSHWLGQIWPRSRFGRLGRNTARFRRINIDQPNEHHDALEFGDGNIVLLTRLSPGQRATVLQLPAQILSTGESRRVPYLEATLR
jgi:hypothetical protein